MITIPDSLRITLSAMALLVSPGPCCAAEMEPLDEYVQQNDFIQKPEVVQYINLRCASLYAFLGVAAQGDAEFQASSTNFRERGEEFLDALVLTVHGADMARAQLFALIGDYKSRFLAAKVTGGGLLADRTIRTDLKLCSAFLANLRAQ